MKLLQKILVIAVILTAVYVPVSYADNPQFNGDIPVPNPKPKPKPIPTPIPKPIIVPPDPVIPPRELTLQEKVKFEHNLTLQELEHALKEFPLFLTNWDFDNTQVHLCDTTNTTLNTLLTIRDLERCDFESKSLQIPTQSFNVYVLKLNGSALAESMLLEEKLQGALNKPVICMIPIGIQWKLPYSISTSLHSVAASPLEDKSNITLSETAPFGGRTYDAKTGHHVDWTLKNNDVVFQGGTVVMFDSLEHLIRYFSLVKAPR